MREKIIKDLRLTSDEATKRVYEQIPEIERKAKRSASAVQYYNDEINKLVDYSNSDVGKYYVGKGFPKFNNYNELIDFMAEYYEYQAEWILNRMVMRGYEPDEHNLLSYMMEDANEFFNNYILEQRLGELANTFTGKNDENNNKIMEDARIILFDGSQRLLEDYLKSLGNTCTPKKAAENYVGKYGKNGLDAKNTKILLYNLLYVNHIISCTPDNLNRYIRKALVE